MRFGIDEQRQIIKGLKCHLKIIKAKQGPLYEPVEFIEEFKAVYRKQCASYDYDESVDGTHHFHMHHPERVAPIINEYFSRLWNKLHGDFPLFFLFLLYANFNANVDNKIKINKLLSFDFAMGPFLNLKKKIK